MTHISASLMRTRHKAKAMHTDSQSHRISHTSLTSPLRRKYTLLYLTAALQGRGVSPDTQLIAKITCKNHYNCRDMRCTRPETKSLQLRMNTQSLSRNNSAKFPVA